MIGPPLESAGGRGPRPGRPRSPRGGERGGISWVTFLLLVTLAGGGYWAWVWAPVYFQNYTVKQVVQDYMNQAIKDRDDAGLRRNMVLKIRSLYDREAVDDFGRAVRVPWIDLDDTDVSWERDARSQPPMLRVSFEYAQEVRYPWLERSTTKVFAVDLTNELTVPNWGPPR